MHCAHARRRARRTASRGADRPGDVGGVAFGIDGLTGNGWIWQNGAYKRIDPAPLLLISTVGDISENGVLVGEAITLDFKTYGYIGIPR